MVETLDRWWGHWIDGGYWIDAGGHWIDGRTLDRWEDTG